MPVQTEVEVLAEALTDLLSDLVGWTTENDVRVVHDALHARGYRLVSEDLLERFVDDEPCRLDHHGLCQEHHLDGPPCGVAQLRAILASGAKAGDHGD